MKWRWMAAGVLALGTLGACGNDDDGGKEKSADGGYDKAAYCKLVKEVLERDEPDMSGLDDELDEESAKALEKAFSDELAFTQKVVDAAPDDLEDQWQSLADVQAEVADNGRKFLDPDVQAESKAMSEDERLEYFFTELLGPFEKVDDKALEAIGAHAESECGVKDLFGEE